jgi:hypothetical protein
MIWKGIAGGLVTAAIVGLSRRGDTLPGILPLSPAFALIALLIVGAKRDGAGFRRAWHLPGLVLGLNDDRNSLVLREIRCRLRWREALDLPGGT